MQLEVTQEPTTRTIILDEMGDLHAPPGSRLWAVAVMREIQSHLKDNVSSAYHLRIYVEALEKHSGYRQLKDTHGQPFATFRAFCEARPPYGLGYAPDALDRIIRERESAQARAETAEPLREHGTNQWTKNGDVDNISIQPGSSNATYLTARIARDRPDILARMKAGEYKSVRAAAVDAGIVKERISISTDVQLAARVLARHFDVTELIDALAKTQTPAA